MAGVNQAGSAPLQGLNHGPFGRLARAQYEALLKARWQMLTHRLRTPQGYWELGASGVGLLFYSAVGLGLSAGIGMLAHMLTLRGEWLTLPVVFWGTLLIWQIVPIGLAWLQSHFDMSGLLRFPLSFASFFLLQLVSGVADIATLLGGLCLLGIWIGVSAARPQLVTWALPVILLFAALNVVLVRLILLWLDRWLAKRRSREIVGAVLVALVLSAQLLNPALRNGTEHPAARNGRHVVVVGEKALPSPASRVAQVTDRWLPPGLAALALEQADRGHAGQAAEAMAGLSLWLAVVAVLLGVRVRAEFRGENLGEAEARSAEAQASSGVRMGGPIAAVLEKELRTTLRSMPVLYALGGPLFMVLVLSSLLHANAPESFGRSVYALPACLAYALMGVSQLIFNAMGTEGPGVRLIFLSPTPVRQVMLAKNLFHGMAFALVAALAWVLTSLRVGWPDEVMTAATVAWLLFALPANLAVGNMFSLVMPHRVDPGRLTRRQGSAANALLTILVQLVLIAIAGGVFLLCAKLGRVWMAVPVFLVLAAMASYAWLRVYDAMDIIAAQNKDLLMQTLARME